MKNKTEENDTSAEMLRVRYAELQRLRKQVEQLESRDSSELDKPWNLVRSDT